MTPALRDLSRLCIHTATTKPWGIEEAVSRYSAAGVRGITVWRTAFADRGPAAAGRLIRDSGLRVVSLCRRGFFPAGSAENGARAAAGTRRCMDEAPGFGAPHVVPVWASAAGQPLEESRRQ